MTGASEMIALPLAFAASGVVLILFDYWAVSAMADGIDFFRWLFG